MGEEGRVFAYLFVFANVFQVRGDYTVLLFKVQYKLRNGISILFMINNCFLYLHLMQGLFIFVLHVVRHEKVYEKIKSKFPNFRKRVSIVKYSIPALRQVTVSMYIARCI